MRRSFTAKVDSSSQQIALMRYSWPTPAGQKNGYLESPSYYQTNRYHMYILDNPKNIQGAIRMEDRLAQIYKEHWCLQIIFCPLPLPHFYKISRHRIAPILLWQGDFLYPLLFSLLTAWWKTLYSKSVTINPSHIRRFALPQIFCSLQPTKD